ncbi:3804_t:CDS:2 [Funneliformis caledonium]|uniref:3804_t:CDS:1 n=1 Tax=Funneliformis caledonium TaxID=1117310 RepID=A0A9N8W600_9GLOM|nr:3804_t:CDS:2 [Funneliformis caledonium]
MIQVLSIREDDEGLLSIAYTNPIRRQSWKKRFCDHPTPTQICEKNISKSQFLELNKK